MHCQETKTELILNLAKEKLLTTIPEANSIFDHQDATYFIYAEFADYMSSKIDDVKIINKSLNFIKDLISTNSEVIENLVVLELFQKFYIDKVVDIKILNYLSDDNFLEIKNLYEKCKSDFKNG